MENIGRILNTGMREIVFSVSSVIYKLIIMFYEIFDFLCGRRLFDNEMLQTFIDRISVILGIVMLFIVIFSFIKMLVDPDKINDKEFGATSTIKKLIIVIVMLGMSSFAFNALYYVQDVVIEENIISKLILPISIDEENSDKFGNVLASGLFMSFYQIDEMMNDVDSDNVMYCNNIINQLDDQIALNGNFSLGRECLTQTEKIDLGEEKVEVFVVDYNYLLSLVVGGVVVYLVFSYCISVGIRMIQLLFLEIISPMAIVSYLMPKKDTMFSKWLKIYIATYVDVFIRIAIINFIIFIIASIFAGANLSFGLDNFNGNFWSNSVLLAIIVIALLTFAKKAPDLLKELFPASASKLGFGMKSPKQIFDGMLGGNVVKAGAKMATVGTAIGAIGAFNSARSRYKMNMKDVDKDDVDAVSKARKKALLGAAGGAFAAYGRGLVAGANSKGNVFKSVGEGLNKQRTIDDKYDQLITSGGSVMGKLGAQLTSYSAETKGQEYTRKIKNNQDFVDAYKHIDDLAENYLEVKIAKGEYERALARGEDSNTLQMLFDNYKTVKKAMIASAVKGEKNFSYEIDAKEMIYEYEYEYEKDTEGNLLKDEKGRYIFKRDESGNKIVVKDVNGNPKFAEDENGHRIVATDEFGNQMYNVVKVKKTGTMDVKASAVASQIKVDFADISNLVSSGRVNLSYVDKNGDNIVFDEEYLKTITEDEEDKFIVADILDQAASAAADSITIIKREPDYSGAIANDKAAGVDSNATANKK